MNETNSVDKLTRVFEKLRDEALDLEMADKFLASVEQKNRLVSSLLFDAGRLHWALSALAAPDSTGEQSYIENLEMIAESELASWRENLEMRNGMIETYHIRRFYDHSEASLDMGLLISLARVFRSLPYSESNKSKFDLVVTRLFTKGNVEAMRYLPFSREKTADALAVLLPRYTGSQSEPDVEGAVEDLDRFISTLKNVNTLEDFIEKNLFEDLRRYKTGLGSLFYHPRVTAAAIECNVTIGNVFAGLVNQVNGPLYDLINNKFDFAGAFHDVSPLAKDNIWDQINHREADDEAAMSSSAHDQIREILEMIGGGEKPEIAEDEQILDLVARSSEVNEFEKSAGDRVNGILKMLSAENPDYAAICREAKRHGALQSVDLEYLFGGESVTLNEICHDVLAIIIWTEELCANELQGEEPLSEVAKSEGAMLIQLSEKYQLELHELMEAAGDKEQTRLLLISNKLLGSHLDLKRLLARYTSSNFAKLESSGVVDRSAEEKTGPEAVVPLNQGFEPQNILK